MLLALKVALGGERERGGYKVLNGKTLLCTENAFVVDVSLLSSTKTTLIWTIIKVVG